MPETYTETHTEIRAGDDILSARQAAVLLGVTPAIVYRLLHRGDLPGRRMGRQWMILRRDVLSLRRRPRGRPRK